MAKVSRVILTVRISPEGLAKIDARAKEADRSRSDMARLLLTYAVRTMPRNWTPT